jgi:Cysteine-rich CWC
MNRGVSGIDPKCCPLCGNANDCGMAAGKEKCWCFTAVISEAVIARVPQLARDLTCICARCAKDPAPARESNE